MLVGSRSKEVIDAGLDRLSTYGLLSDQGTDFVWSLLNALIRAECIAVRSGQYPTISLTGLGGEIMRGTKKIPLVMPARIVSKAKKKAKEKSNCAADPQEGGLVDGRLFEALRKWRRKKAATIGNVPAYLVYTDQTLEELARCMPRTENDLLKVRGIGPAKARHFGTETLTVIQGFIKNR